MIRVHVTREGDALGPLIRNLKNLRPALEAGGAALVEEIPGAFAAGDTYWEPLSPRRVAERGSAHPILVVSGSYRASFKPVYPADNVVAIQSDDQRFPVLQEGGVNEEGFIVPPRPVELSRDEVSRAVEAIWRAIVSHD